MPDSPHRDGGLAERLVDVFMRLASGELDARLPSTYKQDQEDAIAFLVDVLAEQIGEQNRRQREYEAGVATVIEKFIMLASGDYAIRAERTGRGDSLDTMAFLLNNVAVEVGDIVSEHERQRVLLETVLESMLDGVMVLDPQGRIRRTNGAMSKLLGRRTADLIGVAIDEVLAPSERGLADKLSNASDLGPFDNRDTHFRATGDTTLAVAVSGSPHRNANGEAMGFVLVARDDRELRRVNAQLHLSDRLATMGTLAAGVAHEINNPLAFVSANVDFVLEELELVARGEDLSPERTADIIRALRSSRSGALRVRNIVRDLHQFARAEKEGSSRVQLNALLDTALGFVQNEIRHHARLSKNYGKPPAVVANEGRLVQVFLNLILNAAQSIPLGAADKNEIVVSTGVDPKGAFVEISDTGTGIADDDLPRVFDLFYTTKAVGEGTGLGLSIALRLVQQAGGRIDVISKLGEGSTFRVVLPAAPAEVAKRARTARKRRAAPRSRVLVIDDEAEVGEAVRRLLGRRHEVELAIAAVDAVTLLHERSYDLVLCDLLMPDMTGMDLYERLLQTRPEVAQRIVFMTAGAFHPTAAKFLSRVPNRRFDKPFDADTLLGLLEGA
jgi:PAS domain S-box-containing protein